MDYRLEGALHLQQPNPPQSHPKAPELSVQEHSSILNLWGISPSFPGLSPTLGQVNYVLLSRPARTTEVARSPRMA